MLFAANVILSSNREHNRSDLPHQSLQAPPGYDTPSHMGKATGIMPCFYSYTIPAHERTRWHKCKSATWTSAHPAGMLLPLSCAGRGTSSAAVHYGQERLTSCDLSLDIEPHLSSSFSTVANNR